ncbi:ice-binding family protein [Streptomyces scopuliridis]|nr:ice-binding family protein [Streptomyces scopuliridis]WSB34893.1 ice-binding family protein [Streptomyces scopuliridis]
MTLNLPVVTLRRTMSTWAWSVLTVVLAATVIAATSTRANALATPVPLGTATSFAVLAGQSVTNTGPSVITGDLGVSPGTAISGFPPGLVNGVQHSADAVALQAKSDLVAAYNNAAGQATDAALPPDAGGLTLVPGVYTASSTLGLTGTLTLDAQGDPNAVWVFQVGSGLTTASASRVLLINGASPCNVYWQIGSSATLGTGTTFVGTIMALTSISVTTNASIDGRALARNGSVTLDTNRITRPQCGTTTGGTTTAGTTGTTTTGTTTTGTTTGTTSAGTSGSATSGLLGGVLGGLTTGGVTNGGLLGGALTGGIVAGNTAGNITGGNVTGDITGGNVTGGNGGEHGKPPHHGDHGKPEHGDHGDHHGDHGKPPHHGDHGKPPHHGDHGDHGDHGKPEHGDHGKPEHGDHGKPDHGDHGKPEHGDHGKPDGWEGHQGYGDQPDMSGDQGGDEGHEGFNG